MAFVAIILVFLAYTSTNDTDFTFSKRGKAIYKAILVDGGVDEDEDKDDEFLEKSNKSAKNGKKKRVANIKRGPEIAFHLICMLIGAYFSMLFTSWTSLYEHDFDTSVVASNITLWIRFAGTLTGIIYAILMSAINVKARKKYK